MVSGEQNTSTNSPAAIGKGANPQRLNSITTHNQNNMVLTIGMIYNPGKPNVE